MDGDRHNNTDHRESAAGSTGKFISPVAASTKPALSPDTRPSAWSATEAPSWQFDSTPQVLADLTSAGLSDISRFKQFDQSIMTPPHFKVGSVY